MSQQRFRFRPRLESFEDRLCPSSTAVLPISAFLAQQGHDSVFTPPVRDTAAWSNSTFDPGSTPGDTTRLILVDYAGLSASYLATNGIDLHTTITGFVTETRLGDSGLMEVSLNLEARNALTYVVNIAGINPNEPGAINGAPIEAGYRPQELVANPALRPSLSNVHMQETWVQNVGTDLPDLARLNEDYARFAPPGFSYKRLDFQSWGVGTLRDATTVGTPGGLAILSTWQVADLTNPSLPGTLGDGFWQEPIDVIPIASASQHVAYLNGTLFVMDLSNGNDKVTVSPTANGGVSLSSNLGSGAYANVTRVVTALGGGNNKVQIGDLPGVTVDVVALTGGNNQIQVGDVGKLVVSVGGGNNHISTGNTSPGAQFIFVGGHGKNQITVSNSTAAEIIVAGNGNNRINASGTGDFIEVLGNGNNHIRDTGINDLIWLGGDGNNDIDNQGDGSFTEILDGIGHNHIRGHWGFAP